MASAVSSKSIQYKVIRKSFDQLVERMRSVVVEVAAKAFAKELISSGNKLDAENHFINEYKRASSLMDVILNKIDENKDHFDTFIAILKEIPVLQATSDELLQKSEELVHSQEAVSNVQGDYYPGDTTCTQTVQEIYHGVTSDKILLTAHGNTPMTRSELCEILVKRHNTGKNPGQTKTNQQFLGSAMTMDKCLNALTYTKGYDSEAGWEKWAGCHKGTWYGTTQQFIDPAVWFGPSLKEDEKHTYAVQSVRFDSEDRIKNCKDKDMTCATCRYGWNQSGKGVQYVWGWDPKNNDCPKGKARGRSGGTHVGFTFSCGKACCIIWVTNQEAFLECTQEGRRTSTASGPDGYEGYGQWTVSPC